MTDAQAAIEAEERWERQQRECAQALKRKDNVSAFEMDYAISMLKERTKHMLLTKADRLLLNSIVNNWMMGSE